jgi:hypothetical protein
LIEPIKYQQRIIDLIITDDIEMVSIDNFTIDPTLIIAILALIVSIVSIGIGVITLRTQQEYNRLSVRPIGIITLSDYEDKLAIKIMNAGIGPMIIKSVETVDNSGIKKDYPIDWMSSKYIWTNFRRNLQNHAIIAGDSIILLEYNLDPQNKDLAKQRDEIRFILKNLTIRIKYTDIYNKEQPDLIRSLNWFGRNIN